MRDDKKELTRLVWQLSHTKRHMQVQWVTWSYFLLVSLISFKVVSLTNILARLVHGSCEYSKINVTTTGTDLNVFKHLKKMSIRSLRPCRPNSFVL
jgi:hypothetical protein